MAATREDILRWLHRGKAEGASHMLVLCDTFDWDDYPVFVKSVEAARERSGAPGSMQKLMEVYNLSMDWDAQLAEHRAFHF